MAATDFTLDDLVRILRDCAGQAESVELGGDILDVPFADLGYDSLALMEAVSRIQRQYQVRLGDEAAGDETPRLLLERVNGLFALAG
jgi:minimal PKS acyl carrier protein